MTARTTRLAAQAAAVILIVAFARWLCYLLVPTSAADLAAQLEHGGGGPSVIWVSAVGLLAPILLAVLGIWLVRIGVRERARLGVEGWSEPPPLRPLPLLRRAAVLSTASCLGFAGFESWVHYRAGLGFHGLTCLVGPVHRNAIPVLIGLSILATALLAALDLVLAALAGHVLAATRPAAPHSRGLPPLRPVVRSLQRSGAERWPTTRGRPPPGAAIPTLS